MTVGPFGDLRRFDSGEGPWHNRRLKRGAIMMCVKAATNRNERFMATKQRKPKLDMDAEITATVIREIEENGNLLWHKPWCGVPGVLPHNPFSGTEYRGINPFILNLRAMAEGYDDPRWLTFKQAEANGGEIIEAERKRWTRIVFWKSIRIETGETDAKGEEIVKTIPFLRSFMVYNVAQATGLDLDPIEVPADHDPIEAAAKLIEGMPQRPTIKHGGDRAFYRPSADVVQLPHMGTFEDAEAYYGTAFHELVHSTGHKSRLNRKEIAEIAAFGDENYSREELTAELGAAMLCGTAGISPATIEQSAAYLKGWLRALKAEPKLLISAAGRAQKAADFIRGT